MIVYLVKIPQGVRYHIPLKNGTTRSTIREILTPGQSLLGYSYEEVLALGQGKKDLHPKETKQPVAAE